MERTSITVSIDLTDPFEKELYEYVLSKGPRKKSGYIKRLIYADKMGISKTALNSLGTTFADDDEDDDDDVKKAMMSVF